MPVHDIQSTFAGGEASPEIAARVDIEKYKSLLATCRNFINSPHGPVFNRPGTKFVHAAKYSNKKSRLVSFIFSTGDAGVLEFSEKRIRFYTGGAVLSVIPTFWSSAISYIAGQYTKSGGINYQCLIANTNHTPASNPTFWQALDPSAETPYEIWTSYLEADLPLLKFAQSADTIYIAHQNYRPATLKRLAGLPSLPWSGGFSFNDFSFANGPLMVPNTDFYLFTSTSGVVGDRLNSSGNFFNANKVGAWIEIEKYIQSYSYIVDLTSSISPTSSSFFACGGTWRLVTTGTWAGTIVVQKSEDAGLTWTDLQTYVSNSDANINTFGTEPLVDGYKSFFVRLKPQVLTSGTAHIVLTLDAFTAKLYGIIPDFISATQISNPFLGDILFKSTTQNGIAVGAHITIWSEGSWSNDRGWPGVVSFFQDRLCFGSTPTEPQTVWESQVGDYVNFGTSIPLVDSDSIGINLLSRTVNRIRSFLSFLNSLLAFTDSSEWNITSTNGGPITPTEAFAKLQGVRGSGDVDPIMIGNRIIFVAPRGSTARDMVYEYFTDTFSSVDRGIISNHLFKGHSVLAMAYQQEPDSLLWLVRDDGVLLCLTYLLEQEVFAWSRHDTDGVVESICTIPGSTSDQLWMVVNRSTGRFIERLEDRTTSTATADQYFVDCGITYSGSPVSTIPGLSHLNGKTVAILADGIVMPQQLVSGGQVLLSVAASKVHVGLPYTPDMETLCPEFPMRDGTLQGRKYQTNKVVLRVLNTAGAWIGTDADTLDKIDFRSPDISGSTLADATPTPLFTGFIPVTVPQNDDAHGHIFVRQIDPLPITILSIMPLVSPGEEV